MTGAMTGRAKNTVRPSERSACGDHSLCSVAEPEHTGSVGLGVAEIVRLLSLTPGQEGRKDAGMASDRVLAVVAYDDFQLLDLAGPVEVFDVAAKLGVTPGYERVVVTPSGLPVRSSSGIDVAADTSLADLAQRRSPLDTLLVVGGLGSRSAAADHEVVDQLTGVARRARRVTSVCTGALVLAAAGLLDGYHATTHWAWCDELAQSRPGVIVEADRIYVQDRDRWTSAGGDRWDRPGPRPGRRRPRRRDRPRRGGLAGRVRPPAGRPGAVQRPTASPGGSHTKLSPSCSAGCPTTSPRTSASPPWPAGLA